MKLSKEGSYTDELPNDELDLIALKVNLQGPGLKKVLCFIT